MTNIKSYKSEYSKQLYKPKLIQKGSWGNDTGWEFFLSQYLPKNAQKLSTAVFCIVKYHDKYILTKNHRGWEFAGGHIEADESIEQAMQREVKEEVGATLVNWKLIGYRQITSKLESINKVTGKPYPFPISYIPYYFGYTNTLPELHSGEEILDSQLFTKEEIKSLGIHDEYLLDCLE